MGAALKVGEKVGVKLQEWQGNGSVCGREVRGSWGWVSGIVPKRLPKIITRHSVVGLENATSIQGLRLRRCDYDRRRKAFETARRS